MKKLTQEELLGRLEHAFKRIEQDFVVASPIHIQAYTQLKGIIKNAYTIPTTSEREAELEKIITKMQEELDKKPTVTKDEVDLFWSDAWELPDFIDWLKELGVEIAE